MSKPNDRSAPHTSVDEPTPERATSDERENRANAPLKQHGDALLDGSGSRQGLDPDPSRDAAPHE